MTCANVILTILSLAVLFVAIWPNVLGSTASMWTGIVSAVLILVVTWTITDCKICSAQKKKSK